MNYFVTTIQKKTDGTYTNVINRYDTIEQAKVKAYTELAYGFGSDLALCSVSITDDAMNVLYKDVYVKQEPVEDTETTTDTTTTEETSK